MVSRHAALIAFLFALAASAVPARATAGDEQPVADWLGTECGGLNAQQQHRVVALFTADEHEVFTRGDLASLPDEVVAGILSPLPTMSRHVVASAAASLRKSHAGAKTHAGAAAHIRSLRATGSRRNLADILGASLPRWGTDPSVAACALDVTWSDLIHRVANGTAVTFEMGGLGGLTEDPRFGVWLCEDGHACANGTSSFFCWVYDEVAKRFVPWGPDSQLRLVNDTRVSQAFVPQGPGSLCGGASVVTASNTTKCFQYFDAGAAISWDQAKVQCTGWGGFLASINSAAEQTAVNAFLESRGAASGGEPQIYFGYTDRAAEGTWLWDDGSTGSYTNWYNGEPNNQGGVENCGTMLSGFSFRWNDAPCAGYQYHSYMCSRETLRLVNDTLSSGPALVNDTLVYGPPAAVSCANAGVSLADIRLVACRPQSSGSDTCCCRVEVNHDNAWGTVCDDSFDENDAAVACRQAGCATGPSVQQFGGGSGNIWLDNMACSGSEATLGECGHNPWGNHNCVHREDVGVCCGAQALSVPEGPASVCGGASVVTASGKTKCFEHFDVATTWEQAQVQCVANGGSLASINSAEEGDAVAVMFPGGRGFSLWIGFNDRAQEGAWAWTDGSAVAYTNWQSGEPNSNNGAEDCLELRGNQLSGLSWNDLSCTEALQYLCSRELVRDCGSPGYFFDHGSRNGSSWFAVAAGTHAEVTARCEAQDGVLASIHSDADQATARAHCLSETCYIGLSRPTPDAPWVWADGTAVDYTAWTPGQPENYETKVGMSRGDGYQWHDYVGTGSEVFPGICRSVAASAAGCVDYPTNYVYPSSYTTRSLVAVAGYDAGTPSFATVDISATISTDSKYNGGVLLPSGKVVFVPYNADKVGIFDPSTDTFSTVGATISGSNKYRGGVLLPSGKVAFVPFEADKVGIFDPAMEIFSTVGDTISGGQKYIGGVLLPSGKVVFAPAGADKVGVFDPATDTFSTVGVAISGSYKYSGGVLLPSGKVVFVPYEADKVGVFDPATETSSTVGNTISGTFKYFGGVLLPSGKVAFVSYNAGNVGIFDPATDTFSTVGASISTNNMYRGGVLLPSGKVVFAPYIADTVEVFEPGNVEPGYTVSGGVPDSWRALLSPHFNKF